MQNPDFLAACHAYGFMLNEASVDLKACKPGNVPFGIFLLDEQFCIGLLGALSLAISSGFQRERLETALLVCHSTIRRWGDASCPTGVDGPVYLPGCLGL